MDHLFNRSSSSLLALRSLQAVISESEKREGYEAAMSNYCSLYYLKNEKIMSGITYSSTPDYDDWGWDTYWSCTEWIQWHTALKSYYGIVKANQVFIEAYLKAGFGAASYNCRSFSTSFREYARQNGFLDSLYEGVGIIAAPIGWGTDIVGAGTELAGIPEAVLSTVRKIAPLLVILIVVFLFIKFSKQ